MLLSQHTSNPACSRAAGTVQRHHQPTLSARSLCRMQAPKRALHCHASSSSSSNASSTFAEKAQQFANSAQQHVQDFVKEQQLDEKAAEAGRAAQQNFKSWSQETEQNMRRTYMKLESEHNISQRLERTKTWLSETARDIDQEWSVRRRLKSAYEDVQRKWPVWKRQFAEFSATPAGKATITVLFIGLVLSGLFWQLLNVFWLLCWLLIPVSTLIASQRSKQAATAAQQQQQQQQQGPFGSSNGSPFGSGRWSSSSSSSSYRGSNSDGPIVEAEWVSLDEGDSSSKRR